MSVELAKKFHDTYERLAPQFGYETRGDTKRFDPETPNGRLMIAVCSEVLSEYGTEIERELVEALKAVLPLAWRDHRHSEEQLLLENTERLVTKIDKRISDV